MGKIPVYEQGRLASSVVGTPGVDTSAVKMFGDVAQAANAVSTDIAQVGQQNMVMAYRMKREQDRLAKAQKKILDDLDVAKHDGAIHLGFTDTMGRIKAETEKDPVAAPEAFTKQATQDLETYIEGIQDPNVRNKVRLNGLRRIDQTATELGGWSMTQRTENAKADIETLLSEYVNRADKFSTVSDVGKTWEEIESKREAITLAFGEDADKVIRAGKTDVAKQYLNGVMLQDSSRVESIIKSGAFDSVLKGNEKQELVYRANMLDKARERDVKYEQQLNTLSEKINFSKEDAEIDRSNLDHLNAGIINTDHRLKAETSKPRQYQDAEFINTLNARKKEYTKAVEDFAINTTNRSIEDQKVKYNSTGSKSLRVKLDQQNARIVGSIAKDKEAGKYSETILQNIETYKRGVDKAFMGGALTQEDYRSRLLWIEKVSGGLQAKQKQGGSGIKKFINTTFEEIQSQARGTISKLAPGTGVQKVKNIDTASRRYDEIYNAKIKAYTDHRGKPPSPAIMKMMSDEALRQAGG